MKVLLLICTFRRIMIHVSQRIKGSEKQGCFHSFPKLRRAAPKPPREPGAAFSFRFFTQSQRGSVASLLERRALAAACSTESLLSMGTPSSPGQQQPLMLWVSHRSWRLTPVVLFHIKHRNFFEMAQKFAFSV